MKCRAGISDSVISKLRFTEGTSLGLKTKGEKNHIITSVYKEKSVDKIQYPFTPKTISILTKGKSLHYLQKTYI